MSARWFTDPPRLREMYIGGKKGCSRHWLILVMLSTPSSVFVMGFSLSHQPWALTRDILLCLKWAEWKHVPQKVVENGQAVICSCHCDALGARWTSSKWERGGKESKITKGTPYSLWWKYCHCQGQGFNDFVFKIVSVECFQKVIMRVKRNTKHNAGFMYACSDRVLMLGSFTMLAGNC